MKSKLKKNTLKESKKNIYINIKAYYLAMLRKYDMMPSRNSFLLITSIKRNVNFQNYNVYLELPSNSNYTFIAIIRSGN